MPLTEACLRFACSLVIASGLAFFGWAVALRVEVGRLTRWTLAFVASASAATVVLQAMTLARVVSTASLLVAALVLAALGFLAAGRERVARFALEDARAVARLPGSVDRLTALTLAAVAVTYFALAAASSVSPLLGFDSLSYHLVHIAYWAQDGGIQRHPAADAWTYYEFFPIGAELLWGWVVIPMRSNALLGVAGVAVTAMAGLGTVAAARALGATLVRSVLVAAALVALPAISMFATNGYVDNAALAFVVTGAATFLSATETADDRARRVLLVASTAAFGLAVGVKTTMLPLVALSVLANVVLLAARKAPVKSVVAIASASLLAALVIFAPRLLYVASVKGSLLYPWPVRLAGHEISHGNPELRTLIMGAPQPDPPLSALVKELFLARRGVWRSLNFGLPGIVLFATAAIGVVHWVRRRPRDARVLVLVALAIPMLTFFFGESTHGFRLKWWWVIARFMTPAAFSAALFTAALPSDRSWRTLDVVLALAALVGVAIPLTNGMCGYRWVGAVALTVVAGGFVAFAVFAWRQREAAAAIVLGAGILVAGGAALALRPELEGLIVRGAARGECYEAHQVQRPASAYPIWERLADMPAKRIAVVAGFDGVGHEVFRYPLLGREWQHTLVHVSPTEDGTFYDYPQLYLAMPESERPKVSYEAWLARLQERKVDYVVLIGPYDIVERDWLAAHPEHFHLEEIGDHDTARLYAFSP